MTCLLERLEDNGVWIGVATGNVEGIARMKLERAGIAKYFVFGAFVTNAKVKAEVVKTAIRKGRELGFDRNRRTRAVFFGDTPADILAGKSAGASTVGVATGKHSEKELLACGADFAVTSFGDTGKTLSIVLQ